MPREFRPYRLDETDRSALSGGPHLNFRFFDLLFAIFDGIYQQNAWARPLGPLWPCIFTRNADASRKKTNFAGKYREQITKQIGKSEIEMGASG